MQRGLVCFMALALQVVFPLRAAEPSAEFSRLMNLGKAHLENRSSAPAIEQFSAATHMRPGSAPAWRNLARAQMLARQDAEALLSLRRAQDAEVDSAATSYLTGLAQAHLSRFDRAVPALEHAVRLDPHIAALRFQLANAYQLSRRPDQALTQFQETVRLDPLHASAQFKLGTLALQGGDRDEYQRRHQEFLRLRALFDDSTRTPVALERCRYTEPEPAPSLQATFSHELQVAWKPTALTQLTDGLRVAAVLEVNDSGEIITFGVSSDAQMFRLVLTHATNWQATVQPGLDLPSGPIAVLVGNFHDDPPPAAKYDPLQHARNDVVVVSTNGLAVLKQTLAGPLTNVTEWAGLSGVRAWNACWVDYDHDGDLDLAVAEVAGLQLWQNNGNATFSNVTAQVGLGDVAGAVGVAALDLDNNVAIDLVVARGDQSTLVFMNQRAGRFALRPDPPGPWPAARAILTDDLDNDGHLDVALCSSQEITLIYGSTGERKRLALGDGEYSDWRLLDFDNDGWLDLLTVGPGTQAIWRNAQTKWSQERVADREHVLAAVPADFDVDGDTDLLLVGPKPTWLRNDGGNAHRQLKLELLGTKTNPTGLGTRVEVRSQEFWVTRAVSALPLEIGLGDRRRLDSIKTTWANGVQDNQIDIQLTETPMRILENNVAAGSCPYLYAWDGARVRFVTDLLGNAPVGLSLRRGVLLPADPEEIVEIGRDLAARDGYYELYATDELREIFYLDQARLIVVDHPPDVEVHSTDKLQPPPFALSDVWVLGDLRLPKAVRGDDGLDRTEAVRAIDGVYGPPGRLLPPPLRGMCEPLALTIEFEEPLPRTNGVLALTGWLQYGDASVNIALSQNPSVPVLPPMLQAEDAQGRWLDLDVAVGLPAGKTKTILCPLQLPEGCRRLRLTTTFEVRWDRVAVFQQRPPLLRHSLSPSHAELYWRGFSEIRSRGSHQPATPKFDQVQATPPWHTTPEGWCTRYGDVLELLADRDNRLAVLNGGDAIRLRFAALPPLTAGLVRTFFFYSVGWDKDEDYNVEGGDRVGPLPVGEGQDWVTEWNTRWVQRRLP